MTLRKLSYCLSVGTLFVLSSYLFLDLPIATLFNGMIERREYIPEYFFQISRSFPLTCIAVAISWTAYYAMGRRISKNALFFKLLGCTLPIAFFTKFLLKELFGRAGPEVCLSNHSLCGFHWFNSGGPYDSFPSGHMTIGTVVILALWRFYPRWRFLYVTFLVLLAAALIIFDFHFLSDVIAGLVVGLTVDSLTYRALGMTSESQN